MSTGIFITAPVLPLGIRRDGASAGASSNDVRVFLGVQAGSAAYVNSMEEYNGTSWTTSVITLSERGEPAVFNSNSSTFYTGGSNTTLSPKYRGETYEFNGVSWSNSGADLPTPAYSFAGSAGDPTNALVTGGYTGGDLDKTQEFNGTTWSYGGTLPVGRTGGVALGDASAAWCGGSSSNVDIVPYIYNGSSWAAASNSMHESTRDMAAFGTYQNPGGIITGGSFSAGASSTTYTAGTNFRYSSNTLGPTTGLLIPRRSHMASGSVTTGAIIAGGTRLDTSQVIGSCEEYVYVNSTAISHSFTATATGSTSIIRTASDKTLVTGVGGTTLYFAVIVKDDDVPTTTSDTNWTKRLGFESNNAIYIEVWSSEVAGSVTFDGDSEEYTIISFSVSGCNTSLIESATEIVGDSAVGSTPSFTPIEPNSLILLGIGTDQDNIETDPATADLIFSDPLVASGRSYSSTGAGSCSQMTGFSITHSTERPTLAASTVALHASDQWGGWALAIGGVDSSVTEAITGPISIVSGLGDISFALGLQGTLSNSILGTLLEEHGGTVPVTSEGTFLNIGNVGTSIIGSDTTLEGILAVSYQNSLGIQESGSASLSLGILSSGVGTMGWDVFSLVALGGLESTTNSGLILGEYGAHLSPAPIIRSGITPFYKKRKRLSYSFVRESTTNTGVSITIGLKVLSGYARFSDVYSGGEAVYYTIESDSGRETGIGEFILSNRLKRVKVLSTLINGVYNSITPSLLDLTGTSIVSLSPTTNIINNIYQEAETRAFMLMGSF